jgi:hypothetical protein
MTTKKTILADSRPSTPITEMMTRESDDEDQEKDAVVFVRPSASSLPPISRMAHEFGCRC